MTWPSSKAAAVAQRIKLQLSDACARCEVGSMRNCTSVDMVSIVAVPAVSLDMFGDPTGECPLRRRVEEMLVEGVVLPADGSLEETLKGSTSWAMLSRPEGIRVEVVRVMAEDFAVVLELSCCT